MVGGKVGDIGTDVEGKMKGFGDWGVTGLVTR